MVRGFKRRSAQWRNGHEAVDAEVPRRESGFQQLWRVGDIGTKFRRIVAGVNLKQDREGFVCLCGGPVEVSDKFLAVDTLHAVEVTRRELRFVGLKVPNQFPR